MKKFLLWISGFFSSGSDQSSKRLVGIVGAGFLYWTMYTNSHSETHVAPAESLVYSVAALVFGCLGLSTVETITPLLKKKDNEQKTEE